MLQWNQALLSVRHKIGIFITPLNWENDLITVDGLAAFRGSKGPIHCFICHSRLKIVVTYLHSLLVNKVTCRENKVREKGGKGFGCPSKKEEECMLLFGGGQQAGQTWPYSAQVLKIWYVYWHINTCEIWKSMHGDFFDLIFLTWWYMKRAWAKEATDWGSRR